MIILTEEKKLEIIAKAEEIFGLLVKAQEEQNDMLPNALCVFFYNNGEPVVLPVPTMMLANRESKAAMTGALQEMAMQSRAIAVAFYSEAWSAGYEGKVAKGIIADVRDGKMNIADLPADQRQEILICGMRFLSGECKLRFGKIKRDESSVKIVDIQWMNTDKGGAEFNLIKPWVLPEERAGMN